MAISRIELSTNSFYSFRPCYSQHNVGGSGNIGRPLQLLAANGAGGAERRIPDASEISRAILEAARPETSLRAIPTNTGVEWGRALVVSSEMLSFDAIAEVDLAKEARDTNRSLDEVVLDRKEAFENAVAKWNALQSKKPSSLTSEAYSMAVNELVPKILKRMDVDKTSAIVAARKVITDEYSGNMHIDMVARLMADLKKALSEVIAIKYGKHVNVEAAIDDCRFKKIVLVIQDLNPTNDFYSSGKVVGLVREKGGTTDHPALTASAHNIVSMSHAVGATEKIRTGDVVLLNSSADEPIVVNPKASTVRAARKIKGTIVQAMKAAKTLRGRQFVNPVTGKRLSFMINGSSIQDVAHAIAKDTDGCGLFRSEFLFMNTEHGERREEEPSVSEQISFYNALLASSKGKDLVVRTIDVGARLTGQEFIQKDKILPYFDISVERPEEADGLVLCLNKNTPLYMCFRNQLEAMLQSDLQKVMFPQVRTAAEIEEVFAIIKNISSHLRANGKKVNKDLQFGIMVENKEIYRDLRAICKKYKLFMSIGSNDLTTSVTGISRYSESEQTYYEQQFSAGVREKLKESKKIADETGTSVSVCGNIVNDWRGFLLLLAMGFDKFSFSNVQNADIARKIASGVDGESLKVLLRNLDQINTPHQAMRYVEQFAQIKIESGAWKLADIWPYIQAVFTSYTT